MHKYRKRFLFSLLQSKNKDVNFRHQTRLSRTAPSVCFVFCGFYYFVHCFLLSYRCVKLQTLWPEVVFPLSNLSKCRIPKFLRAAYLCGVYYIWTCPQAPSGHRGHFRKRWRLPNKLRPLCQACNFTFPHLAGK